MVKILHTLGSQFRLVGPLTLANAVVNPGFEGGTAGWTVVNNGSGLVTLTPDTTHFKFGTTSCRVDVATGSQSGLYYGLSQTLTDVPAPGQDYTLSAWIYIPVDLPKSGSVFTKPFASAYYFDSANALLATHRAQLTLGTATSDWTKASLIETAVPDGTASAKIEISALPASASTAAFTYYVDGLIWSKGDTNDYVDGDFASYVWSGDRFNSTTLLSTAPDALASFRDDVHSGTPHQVVS